ncbi:hypothetical protein [Bradyrhizobium sp. SZCCHNR3003]|uniref:hypothetical protein n=1 Tax=Bradyrhizobium sp. SZCCHNR3003 TaxID=3057387 RepID=UPI002916CBD3|nr:hypothetical protein [Bradyrhizobium sp. SZCCHNR3003]
MSYRNRMIGGAATAITDPRPLLRGREAIEQMADDMRIMVTRTGGVTTDDLTLIGWKQEQVDTLAPRARNLATKLSTVVA